MGSPERIPLMTRDHDYNERLFTIPDVADICVVSTKTVRCWIKAGELHAIRLGRQWRIARKDLERFIRDNRS